MSKILFVKVKYFLCIYNMLCSRHWISTLQTHRSNKVWLPSSLDTIVDLPASNNHPMRHRDFLRRAARRRWSWIQGLRLQLHRPRLSRPAIRSFHNIFDKRDWTILIVSGIITFFEGFRIFLWFPEFDLSWSFSRE